jgi:transcriptional regulator with XRE-family HTH domain
MSKPSSFGVALSKARESLGLSQTQIARHFQTYPNTVYRWERTRSIPSMEMRIELLKLLKNAPREHLEALAAEANVELETIGLGVPPAPSPAPVPPAAPPQPTAPPLPAPVPATAQQTVDDALREMAEELELLPKALRPSLSRMLERLARTGVPMDAASRMVLGVPKKPSGAAR